MATNPLLSISNIVVLMLENRSFDHMLGFLYTANGNISPTGAPFDGLTGDESNPDDDGNTITVTKIQSSDENAYYTPGADPGEGYSATNSQLFGATTAPSPADATNQGFVTDYSYTLGWEKTEKWSILPGTVANDIMSRSSFQIADFNFGNRFTFCHGRRHWETSRAGCGTGRALPAFSK